MSRFVVSAGRQAITGTAWISILHHFQQFVLLVILARLLLPQDYGLYGMVAVFLGFVGLIVEPVLGSALVQRRKIAEVDASSVFWFKAGLGICLAALFALLAPVIAGFYRVPQLVELSLVLAISFPLVAAGIVPRALLQRRLAFRRLAVIDQVAWLLASVGAILLALRGNGVWSLVFQGLAAQALTTLLLFVAAGWLPRLIFSANAVRELMGYSAGLLGSNVLSYWTKNSSALFLGQFVGAVGLGIFGRAYNLITIPVSQAFVVLGRVVFPLLAASQDDPEKARRIYLRATGIMGFLVFPLMAGLLVTADSLVLALLGPNWEAVASILQVLCLAGVVQAVSLPVTWIYTSRGETSALMRWSLLQSAITVPAVLAGALLGTVSAVAWTLLMAHLVLVYPCITLAGRFIGVTWAAVMQVSAGALTCSVLMAGLIWSIDHLLPPGWPPWASVGMLTLCGGVVYIVLAVGFDLRAFRDVREVLLGKSLKREAAMGAAP